MSHPDEPAGPTVDVTAFGDAGEGANETLPEGQATIRRLVRGEAVSRYIIVEPIGGGGMGTVYVAYDPELDRRIALKLLKPNVRGRRLLKMREHLVSEARAIARLSHSNVVAVYDAGEHEQGVFLAMEYVEGETLRDWMNAGPREAEEILPVLIAAGRGLEAAHGAGLIHRDFKPENVMIARDGAVKVVDFGLAVRVEDFSLSARSLDEGQTVGLHTAAFVGTPAYMSPEQHLGYEVDARADQFAYCVVAYEILYGQHPYRAATVAGMAIEIADGTVREPPADARVPAWVRKMVLKGLARDAGERFPGMSDLLAELDRKPARLRPILVPAALALTAAGIGIGLFAGTRAAEAPPACTGVDAPVAAVWNSTRAHDIERAFTNTGVGYAESTYEAVQVRLDEWAARWAEGRRDSCEATMIRGEQSAQLMDLRMACLDRQLQTASSIVEVFEDADRGVVQRAVQATTALPRTDACADTERLLSAIPPPPHEVREEVQSLRGRLARAHALELTGQFDDAQELVEEVRAHAVELPYEPLEVEALRRRGALQVRLAEHQAAESSLRTAASRAIGLGMDEEATLAMIDLLFAVAKIGGRVAEAQRWAEQTRGFVRRVDPGGVLELKLTNYEGMLEHDAENPESALARYDAALELSESLGVAGDVTIVSLLNNRGLALDVLGRSDEARAMFARAIAVLEDTVGPGHPHLAATRINFGSSLYRYGLLEPARDAYAGGLKDLETALGPDSVHLAAPLENLGMVERRIGRVDEALALTRRALSLREAHQGPQHLDVAATHSRISAILFDLGRHDEAKDAIAKGLAIAETAENAYHVLGPLHQNLGHILADERNYSGSLREHQRAVDILEQAYGEENPQVAVARGWRANARIGTGDLARGEREMTAAVEEVEAAFGPEHGDLAGFFVPLARARHRLGKRREALELVERALELANANDPGGKLAREAQTLRDAWSTEP